jgi:aspartate racemase
MSSTGEKRRIGILGGISHESTAAYYQRLHTAYYAQHRNYAFPEVVVYSLDFQRFTDLENGRKRGDYIAYILQGLHGLAAAGADFGVMSANSPHSVFAELAADAPLPLLSIAEVTAQAAQAAGAQRLLLLGIQFTMQADFYPKVCAKYDIEVVTPSKADQKVVNRLIFDELALGRFTPAHRQTVLDVISRMGRDTAFDGVILGCTELPLLLQQEHCSVPLYDTMALHVQAALRIALGASLPDMDGAPGLS